MDHIGVFKILEKLVSFETVSPPGNEAEAASYLANLLTAFGLQCRVQELGNDRARANVKWSFGCSSSSGFVE